MRILSKLLTATLTTTFILLAGNSSTQIRQEILSGHLTIQDAQDRIPLTQQVKAPNGSLYIRGRLDRSIGGGDYEHVSMGISVDNITPLHGSRNRFLIPYGVGYGGSGSFMHLGLFQADFIHHTIMHLGSLLLGDRVQDITVHSGRDASWVVYRDPAYGESMANRFTHTVKKILTFDADLTHITTPSLTDLSELHERVFKPYAYPHDNEFKLPPFITEEFYLLGYSPEGKRIAYILNSTPNVAGIIAFTVVVQDLLTDKTLWKYRVHSGENPPDKITFEYYWLRDHHMILDKLKELGITLNNHLLAKGGDIHYQGDILSYHVTNRKKPNMKGDQPTVWETNVTVTSKKHGTKSVHHWVNKQEYSFILDTQAIGYFTLPGTPERVALIVSDLYRGYEGPPHEVTYSIIGVSLTKGFKK